MHQPRAEDFEHELAERRLRHFMRYAWPNIDPADYVHGWHLDAIAEHLESVADGEIRRLIINVPPRSMKSIAVAVAFPAWVWAQRKRSALTGPGVSFLSTSYAQHLSMRDAVKCRRLIESPWYRRGWGDRFKLVSDQNTKLRYENDRGGVRIASSVDGTATGDGGDIVIVDDPISAGDALSENVRATVNDWFATTMSTRLNDARTGAFVIVQQRLNEDDLVGHLLNRDDASEWTVLCLPARYERDHPLVYAADPRKLDGELLWPERMPEAEVAKLEAALGSLAAAGQLQQRPAPRGGGMFQRHWFDVVPVAPAGLAECRAWDFAATVAKPGLDPDWTVGLKMGRSTDGFYYIVNMVRLRETAAKVEQALLRTTEADGLSCIEGDPSASLRSAMRSWERQASPRCVE